MKTIQNLTLFLFLLSMSNAMGNAQELIWSETFDYPDGTVVGVGQPSNETSWSIQGGKLYVQNNSLHIPLVPGAEEPEDDVMPEVDAGQVWSIDESNPILLVGYVDVVITMDLTEIPEEGEDPEEPEEDDAEEMSEVVKVQYKLDGGEWMDFLVGSQASINNNALQFKASGLSGKYLSFRVVKLRIDEGFEIDNIRVVGTRVVEKFFYTRGSGDWTNTTTWTHNQNGEGAKVDNLPGGDTRLIILDGDEITMDDDVNCEGSVLEISENAMVDMTNRKFKKELISFRGQGTLKLASTQLPPAINNAFCSPYGGTLEFDMTNDFDLPLSQSEYNHLVINGGATSTQKRNLTIHGDLTINAGNQFVVKPGMQLTVKGKSITNKGLLLENTYRDPSSLISQGAVTDDINIKWTFGNGRWWFIGHVISNPNMDSYETIKERNGNIYALYDYNEEGKLVNLAKISGFNLANQNKLRGYQLRVLRPNTEVIYSGALNNDPEYSRPLQDGWQIIANPYASYYQLPHPSNGNTDFANTTGSVFLTDVATSNRNKSFVTYNVETGMSSPSGFTGVIAPTQAFYVKTSLNKAGQPIYMRAENRMHDVNKTHLKSAKAPVKDIIRIKLDNSQVADEAVIALLENGSVEFNRMDSEQRFMPGNSASYIYSIIDGHNTVINTLPKQVAGHQVELGMKAYEGDHVLYIEGLDDFGNNEFELVLEDKATESLIDMTADTKYEFNTQAGSFDSRFVLHFKKKPVPTTIDEELSEDEETDVLAYVKNNSTLYVKCGWDVAEKKVTVFTVGGQQVMSKKFHGYEFSEEMPLSTGIYILKINALNKSFEQKVFVK